MSRLSDAARYAVAAVEHVRSRHAGFPSLVVALAHEGGQETVAQGMRDIRGGDEVTSDTLYALASCLKPMTASGLVQALIAAGQGSSPREALDATLDQWLRSADEGWSTPPSVADLLSHRLDPAGPEVESGSEYILDGGTCPQATTAPLGSFPPEAAFSALQFRPTTQYQNDAYTIAGYLLACLTNPSPAVQQRSWAEYDQAMRNLVWLPLKMGSTRVVLDPPDVGQIALPYAWTTLAGTRGRSRLVRKDCLRMAAIAAAEAWTSPRDLRQFAAVAAGAANPPQGAERLAETVRGLVAAQAEGALTGDIQRAGPGWMRLEGRPGERWHRGDKVGYQAVIGLAPEKRAAVIVLCNVHGEDEFQQRGLNALGWTVQRLAEAVLDALTRGAGPTLASILGPRTREPAATPIAGRRSSATGEWELAYESEDEHALVVHRSGVRTAVARQPSRIDWSPADWVGVLNVGDLGSGWQVYETGLPPEFVRDAGDQGPGSVLRGEWIGSLTRPWWWSKMELGLGTGDPTSARVRVANRAVMAIDSWALGLARAPGAPASSPLQPAVHAEGPAPDRGGYGFIDVAGGPDALLGDWVIEGERYHVALRRPDPVRPRWWPPMDPGTWAGLLGEGPDARPLRLVVQQVGGGRRRAGFLSLAPAGGEMWPLFAFEALNGALRFSGRAARHAIAGWGAFVGVACAGSLRMGRRTERFALRRVSADTVVPVGQPAPRPGSGPMGRTGG